MFKDFVRSDKKWHSELEMEIPIPQIAILLFNLFSEFFTAAFCTPLRAICFYKVATHFLNLLPDDGWTFDDKQRALCPSCKRPL